MPWGISKENMKNLKVARIAAFAAAAFLPGCAASSFYKVTRERGERKELSVSPDRILLECEEISKKEDRYGFLIHILDDENSILSVIRESTLPKKDCYRYAQGIEPILKNGKRIYIAGWGGLENPRKKRGGWAFRFPGKGVFHTNGRSLQFAFIANEHGQCYSLNHGSEKPCPRNEFPIGKEF
jgi:hypothetical protein